MNLPTSTADMPSIPGSRGRLAPLVAALLLTTTACVATHRQAPAGLPRTAPEAAHLDQAWISLGGEDVYVAAAAVAGKVTLVAFYRPDCPDSAALDAALVGRLEQDPRLGQHR